MLIHIIDPGYYRHMGHHVDWDLSIAKELVKRGHEIHLFCHKDVTPKARQSFAEYGLVTPLFENDPYIEPKNPVDELTLFIDLAMIMAEQLQRLPKADLWLFPTMYAPQLLACAIANSGIPISALLHLEPTGILPFGKVWWAYAFMKADRRGLKLNLATTTTDLQEIYSNLSPPVPIKCAPMAQEGLIASAPKTSMRKIGFFGDQRDEKGGVTLISALIKKLLDEGYEVVLQHSLDRPELGNVPNLTTLGYVENFAKEIAKCDLVMLPYNPEKYRYRLSGVAAEAVASGVPIVAPAGTPMEGLVRKTGAGALFWEYTLEGILKAVSEAELRYTELAEAAFKTSQTWASKHGYSNLVSSFLEGVAK